MARAHFRDTILLKSSAGYLVPASGATVTARQQGTTTAITQTMYAASSGGTTLANPLTADTDGVVEFWLDTDERVDLYVVLSGYTAVTVTAEVVSQASLSNPTVQDTTDPTKALAFDLASATTGTTVTLKSAHTAARTVTLPNATTTLVGTDTADTLTAKTIDLAANTLAGTLAQFNAALTGADFASLAGAEELTNKTLTAAVAKGVWTASGTWTIPAVTLGGTLTATGQTVTGGTFSGPTLSGSVAGTPTWASAQTFPGITVSATIANTGNPDIGASGQRFGTGYFAALNTSGAATIGTSVTLTAGNLTLSSGTQAMTAATTGAMATWTNTDAGALGVRLIAFHNSASPGVNDVITDWIARAKDSNANTTDYARLLVNLLDPTDGSEDGEWSFQATIAGTLTDQALRIGNGVLVGNPTGGYKGHGTLNAIAVYDDNTLLTDHIFDLAYDGRVRTEDEAQYGAVGLLSIAETEVFARTHRHLPSIPGRAAWEQGGSRSVGQMVTHLWETVERQALHLFDLNRRLTALEPVGA